MIFISVAMTIFSYVSVDADTNKKVEGDGYDSPEEAAIAFLNALRNDDLEAMIRPWAIESYVDNYRLDLYADRYEVLKYSYGNDYFPIFSDFSRDLDIEWRKNYVCSRIRLLFLRFAASPLRDPENVKQCTVYDKEEQSVDDFISYSFGLDRKEAFSNIEFCNCFIDANDLTDKYNNELNREIEEQDRLLYGLDCYTSIVPVIRVDDVQYAFCFGVGSYNDKWYLINVGGLVGNLFLVPSVDEFGIVDLSKLDNKAKLREKYEELQ